MHLQALYVCYQYFTCGFTLRNAFPSETDISVLVLVEGREEKHVSKQYLGQMYTLATKFWHAL